MQMWKPDTPSVQINGYKSDTSIKSYSTKPSFQQKQKMSAILSSFVGGENFNTSHQGQQIGETNSIDIPRSCLVIPRPPLENLLLSMNVQQPSTSITTLPSRHPFLQASAPNFQFQGCSTTIVNNDYFGSPQ